MKGFVGELSATFDSANVRTSSIMNRGSFVMRRCVLLGVEAVEAHSSHTFSRHTHDAFGIGLIISGAQRSWSGRGSVEAEQGNLITCNPEEVHDGKPLGGSRAWKMLYLRPELMAALIAEVREGGDSDFEFTTPVIEDHDRAGRFAAAYRAVTDKQADASHAHERLMLLLDSLSARKSEVVNDAPAAMRRVKEFIDADPCVPITLADLSAASGSSRFQVVRGFFKLTGLTPHAYIIQQRLNAARSLLRKGIPLTEAAVIAGFADQSHLHRTFVQRYGVTLGEYVQGLR
jgi:AraC-like DNA-binding protein